MTLRRTPLRAKKKWDGRKPAKIVQGERVLRKPLAKVGARGKRLEPLLNRMRREVRKRSQGWCEVAGCRERAVECHHTFGRGGTGARLGDRWAHHPALGADLCRYHHDLVERDSALDRQLRWAAVDRLARTMGWVRSVSSGDEPVDAVRALIGAVEMLEVEQ